MTVSPRHMLAAFALLAGAALPGAAFAQCCQARPTTPVPQVNVPTNPSTPSRGCCNSSGGGVRVGVVVGAPTIITPVVTVPTPVVIVNHSGPSVATAISISSASASSSSTVIVGGGGGGGFGGGYAQSSAGAISLTSSGAASAETRTVSGSSRIEAICMDDTGSPHPASQTFAGEAVPATYRGEVFRCVAGTAMRYTIAGQTADCTKGQALVYDGEKVVCLTQEARRPCNERSLLRRFGPGAKVATLRTTQTVQTTRRETLTASSSSQMSLDGGVGQGVW